ncbi:MAG: hypothetical protein D6714_20110 [Bacteroidetes bacterium]|nr:MAG: hypothetical protein D6714_20110 [Bacteroidota bacterium]
MCTVTYIPQNNGFLLTSNRDENAARSPQNLSRIQQNGATLLFPRDTTAGGTWIAVSDTEKMVCLLNGAFVKHKHRPPYKRSRGIMVLDFFKFPKAENFFDEYDFEGMEPFTTVLFDRGNLFEFRWDEKNKHIRQLDPNQKYIWSSCTLYPPDIQAKRKAWFDQWIQNTADFSRETVLDFHQNGGEKDAWNGFVMNRMGLVQTVSITSIQKTAAGFDMKYLDLIRKETKQGALTFAPTPAPGAP